MLAIAAAPGRFVAENWPRVLEAQWQRMPLEVIEIEAADRRGILRAQAEIALVQAKGIEVLPQLLAKAAKKEIALLQYGSINRVIPCPRQKHIQAINYLVLLPVSIR